MQRKTENESRSRTSAMLARERERICSHTSTLLIKEGKNRVTEKLRSQTGASITFGLLIFLVCAILSSVLLTAATASSGRMSGVAEADQRYYAVTSAAELLEELFKKHSVISLAEKTETTYTTNYEAGIVKTTSEDKVDKTVYIITDKKGIEINEESDFQDINKVVDGYIINTFQKDAVKRIYDATQRPSAGDLFSAKEFNLTSSKNAEVLTVAITEKLDNNGNIIFTLYNRKGVSEDGAGLRYTLELPFNADKSITKRSRTETGATSPVSETKYKVTTKRTDIEIITLEWTSAGVKVVGG